jgi:hypothetical protein
VSADQVAAGGVPMARWSTPPGPSLVMLSSAERDAIAFADGVLTQSAKYEAGRHPQIAETYRESAEVLRSLLDRLCR